MGKRGGAHMSTLMNMGGYGIYIWPAYGITLLVFSINLLITLNERHQIKKLLRKLGEG